MEFYKIMAVGLGGFLGSVCRYATVRFMEPRLVSTFPFGTFTVNILGSVLIGLLYGLMIRKADLSDNVKLFAGVGFCGGFTTFSAFAWENYHLLQDRLWSVSILYMAGSVVAGLVAVAAGIALSRFV